MGTRLIVIQRSLWEEQEKEEVEHLVNSDHIPDTELSAYVFLIMSTAVSVSEFTLDVQSQNNMADSPSVWVGRVERELLWSFLFSGFRPIQDTHYDRYI